MCHLLPMDHGERCQERSGSYFKDRPSPTEGSCKISYLGSFEVTAMRVGDTNVNNDSSDRRKPKYLHNKADCFQRHVLKTTCFLEYPKFLSQKEHIELCQAGLQWPWGIPVQHSL